MTLATFIQYFLLFAIVFDASIAWFVLLKNPKKAVNQAYFFMISLVTVWQISSYIFSYHYLPSVDVYLALTRTNFIAGSFIAVAILYFGLIYPNKKHNYNGLLVSGLIGTIIALISSSKWLIVIDHFESTIGFDHGYGWFLPYFITFQVAAFVIFICVITVRYRKTQNSTLKKQFEYLLIGLTVPFIIAIITNLIIPLLLVSNQQYLFEETSLLNIGQASTIFFSALTAYTILRHRLMDIRAVIRRNVITLVAYSVTLLTFFLIGLTIIRSTNTYLELSDVSAFTLLLAILLILAKPIRLGVQRIVHMLIKHENIDIHQWTDLEIQQLNKVETPEELAWQLTVHLQGTVILEHTTCIMYDQITESYKTTYTNLSSQAFSNDEPWVRALTEYSQLFAVDQISELSWKKNQKRSVSTLCDKYQADIALPMVSQGRLVGVWLLGKKVDDTEFSSKELIALRSFQTAAADTVANLLRLRKFVREDVEQYETTHRESL